MAFDETKQKTLMEETITTPDNTNSILSVGVYTYDNKNPKLGMIRKKIDEQGKEFFIKLGRLALDEIRELQKLMPKIIETIEDFNKKQK